VRRKSGKSCAKRGRKANISFTYYTQICRTANVNQLCTYLSVPPEHLNVPIARRIPFSRLPSACRSSAMHGIHAPYQLLSSSQYCDCDLCSVSRENDIKRLQRFPLVRLASPLKRTSVPTHTISGKIGRNPCMPTPRTIRRHRPKCARPANQHRQPA
jgi:hypothetical protein